MAELTPENFVSRIKAMAPRERGKLLKDDLINLILQLPELSAPSLESFNALEHFLFSVIVLPEKLKRLKKSIIKTTSRLI